MCRSQQFQGLGTELILLTESVLHEVTEVLAGNLCRLKLGQTVNNLRKPSEFFPANGAFASRRDVTLVLQHEVFDLPNSSTLLPRSLDPKFAWGKFDCHRPLDISRLALNQVEFPHLDIVLFAVHVDFCCNRGNAGLGLCQTVQDDNSGFGVILKTDRGARFDSPALVGVPKVPRTPLSIFFPAGGLLQVLVKDFDCHLAIDGLAGGLDEVKSAVRAARLSGTFGGVRIKMFLTSLRQTAGHTDAVIAVMAGKHTDQWGEWFVKFSPLQVRQLGQTKCVWKRLTKLAFQALVQPVRIFFSFFCANPGHNAPQSQKLSHIVRLGARGSVWT